MDDFFKNVETAKKIVSVFLGGTVKKEEILNSSEATRLYDAKFLIETESFLDLNGNPLKFIAFFYSIDDIESDFFSVDIYMPYLSRSMYDKHRKMLNGKMSIIDHGMMCNSLFPVWQKISHAAKCSLTKRVDTTDADMGFNYGGLNYVLGTHIPLKNTLNKNIKEQVFHFFSAIQSCEVSIVTFLNSDFLLNETLSHTSDSMQGKEKITKRIRPN